MAPSRYPVGDRTGTIHSSYVLLHGAKLLEKRRRAEVVEPSRMTATTLPGVFSDNERDEAKFQLAVFDAFAKGPFNPSAARSAVAVGVVRMSAERLYDILRTSTTEPEIPAPQFRDCLIALRNIVRAIDLNGAHGANPVFDTVMERELSNLFAALRRGHELLRADIEKVEQGELELRELDPQAPTHERVAKTLSKMLGTVKDSSLDPIREGLRHYPEDVFSLALDLLHQLPDEALAHQIQVAILDFGRYRDVVRWDLGQLSP